MIRIANNGDIERINELGLSLNKNFSITYNLNDYLENDKYIILVSYDQNVNGFLIAYNNLDNIELEAIVVDINKRKEGIGSTLLEYLINYAKREEKSILLEVASNNTEALNLYKKDDFKIINIRKNYYNNQIDAYMMKRVI